MLIKKLIRVRPEEDTEVVEAENESFEFTACGQLDTDPLAVAPYPVKKLILNIDLDFRFFHLFSSL